MEWPEHLRARGAIQNLLAQVGAGPEDIATIFHGMSWPMDDGSEVVTLAEHRPADTPDPPDPPDPPSFASGLHDRAGLEWMHSQGMKGCALVLVQVQEVPALDLDFTSYHGIDVFLRLGWGYADGSGTIAPPNKIGAHCYALAKTVNSARGVKGVQFWNEVNNPSEWPGGWPNPAFIVSPQYVASSYVTVCNMITTPVLLSPPPVDPYNVVAQEYGQPADPKTWAETIYHAAPRVGWISMHAKTQGSDLGQIDGAASYEVFGHPIEGRFQHLRTVEDQLAWVPEDLRDKPIVVSELNPQRKADGSLGWDANGPEWWTRACNYLRGFEQIKGAMAYRYEVAGGGQEPFGLENRPDILESIKQGE